MELAYCVPAKLPQACLTLCNPKEYSLPVFSVLGILQAGIRPVSLMSPALAARFFIRSITWEAQYKRLLVWKCAIIVVFFNLNILVK